MKLIPRLSFRAALALGAAALWASHAAAQVSGLGKGQLWFLGNGLQVQGLSTNFDPWDLTKFQNANYTAVNWLWDSSATQHGAAPGNIPWARWVRPPTDWNNVNDNGEAPPLGNESTYMSKLIALSLGDEPDLNDAAVRTKYVNWFNRMSALYPNQLLYMNNYGGQVTDAPLGDFISRAHPDMISFDTYPYRYNAPNDPTRVQPAGGSPTNWYGDLRRYREHALGNNIPLGMYRQTYHSTNEGVRDTSDSELRLMTFAGLAFNAKYFTDFTYNSGASSMYGAVGNGQPVNAYYNSVKQINSEVRNLGPAMVRLKPIPAWNVDQTTNILIIHGRHDIGGGANAFNANPIGFVNDNEGGTAYTQWDNFNQHNDPWLTGWGITNLGTKNSGLKGDVMISWFKPLDEWFDGDDWNNEVYMMVTNGLADMDGTGADTKQQIVLSFGTSTSPAIKFPYTYVQRLNRLTGLVENVPVTSVDANKKNLTLTIEGGTGDLIKFPDGAPFVGTLPRDAIWQNASGGAFATGGNWDIGASPNGNYFAHFGTLTTGAGPYSVSFANNMQSTGAFVHRDITSLSLGGFTYTLNGLDGVDSLIVGMYAGENAQLSIGNGSLNVASSATNFSQVGKAAGATGIVTVGAGGKWINAPTLLVGKLGIGTVNVNASVTTTNGAASFTNVYLGGSPTLTGGSGVLNVNGGSVSVSGTLKVWNNSSTINLSAGNLLVGSLDTNGSANRINFSGGTLDLTASSLTISGAGPFASLSLGANKTLRVSGAGSTLKNSPGSIFTVNGGRIFAHDIDLTTGAVSFTSGTIEIDNGPLKIGNGGDATYSGAIIGNGSLTKSGSNAITLAGISTFTGSTNVAGGKLIFATPHLTSSALNVSDNATAQFASGGANVLRTGTINTNTTGRVDLNDSPAIIDYSGQSPAAYIRNLIQSGSNNGSWNGNGIMSTLAQNSTTKTAIGFAEASSLFTTFPAMYADQPIDNTTILLRYTVPGDADFSGKTDITDFNSLATNFGKSNKIWRDGDFDYNGTVDILDFNMLASNFGKTSPNSLPPQALRIDALSSSSSNDTVAVPLPAPVATGAVGLVVSLIAAARKKFSPTELIFCLLLRAGRMTRFFLILIACASAAFASAATDLHYDYTSFDNPNTPGVTPHFGQSQFNVLNYPSINGNYMMTSTDGHRTEMRANNNELAQFYNNFLADYNAQPAGQKDAIAEADKINAYSLSNSTHNGLAKPTWLILNEISASLWPPNPGAPNLSTYRQWVVDCVTRLHDVHGFEVVTFAPFATVGTGAGSNAASWQALAQKSYIGIENYLSGEEVMNGGATYAARLAWAQSQYNASKATYTANGVPFDRLFLGEHFGNTTAGTVFGRAGLSASDWDTVIQIRQDAIRAVGFPGFLAYSWGSNAMLISEAEQIQHEYWYRTRLVLPGQQPQWLSDSAINVNGTTIPLSWSEQLNWLGGVPNGAGAIANFYRTNTASRTVTLDGAKTMGVLSFNSPSSYTIAAGSGGAITLDNAGAGATVSVPQGTHTIGVQVALADNSTFDVASTLSLTGGLTNASGKTITKNGIGVLTISGTQTHGAGAIFNANAGVTNFNSDAGGNLTLNANATVNLNSPQKLNLLTVATGKTVTIASGGTNTLRLGSFTINGKLDLNDNPAIIDYSGDGPIATIRQLIKTGYNNGIWNGTGITSGAAQNSIAKAAIAFAEASKLFSSFPATYAGQTIDNTTIVMRYTVPGDADFSGKTDILDFNSLAANFGKTNMTWRDGDFDYSGTVDITDFNLLATSFGKSTPNTLPTQSLRIESVGSAAAVPLPAPMYAGLVGLVGACLASWQYRRRR